MSESVITIPVNWLRIDEINRSSRRNAMGKSCSRIHIEARTNDNKDVLNYVSDDAVIEGKAAELGMIKR